MRIVATIIFVFFSVLSVMIYLTKNYQYEEYIFKDKKNEIKSYLINLNLATWHDFATLPGVSDNLAKAIVADRANNGRFDDINEIKRVKGIGAQRFEKIKEYLTLEI